MAEPEALRGRIDELEQELALLRACEQLSREADEALEEAMRDRQPLDRAMRVLMPILCRHAGACRVAVRTYGEDLQMRDFEHRASDAAAGNVTSVSQTLDVAGEAFGEASIELDGTLDERARSRAARLLDTWCEELDNYLAAIARAREKHVVTGKLSQALTHPVLEVGVGQAIDVLQKDVSFDDLILASCHEDDSNGETLSFKVLLEGKRVCDSSEPNDSPHQRFMSEHALAFIGGDERAVLDHFGIESFQEQVLINGVKDRRVIGRLLVTSRRGEFNTFDRDLLERFADYLRSRLVDFNREYKHLALCFPPAVVSRLLSSEDYVEQHLRARERPVAVMFCDVAGFTRLSEQVLRAPSAIARFIDGWSEEAVRIIWQSGGVFDKMVGDCVIGLWGPPFFELSPRDACRRALDTARQIRDFTATLADSAALPELRGLDITVSTGLNHCPLFVGLFGPNEGYTGFSAGMNNSARLQGLAEPGQILCMEGFVEAHGEASAFGETLSAKVKNVGDPLLYREALPGASQASGEQP
jgi:class 3 adenylate cyclase